MKKFTKPLESATRIKVNNWLVNLGWILEEDTPACNCFTERARTVAENKLLKGHRPDYVLYSSDKKPMAIIEAKRSHGSLAKALEETIRKYAKPLGIKVVFITDGLFIQAYHVQDEDFLYFNAEMVTELLSEKRLQRFVEGGSKIFSPKKVVHSKVELIKIFQEANDILRKDGLSEGKERFTEFSNLLFLKLISDIEDVREEQGAPRRLAKAYCWDTYKDKDAGELQPYINHIVLPRFDRAYNHTSDIFNKRLLINKAENLQEIVAKISKIGNLLDTHSDIKGDAFEYFLKNSVSVGNDLGEYFTPRHIVKVMVALMDLKFGEKVYDPCCGTGGFLIEAFKDIKAKCKHTEDNLAVLENQTVFGREIATTSKIAKMNMIIMGDGHNNIAQMDSLEYPVHGKYDVCLTNYAFSQKTNYGSLYGFDTSDANPVFLKHIYDSLTDTGRAAVIVPDGVLFDGQKEYQKIRKILVDQANVEAVIRLHTFVFEPYTSQPTSVIVFNKGAKTEKVWFFDVEEDGFQKTKSKRGRRKVDADDLVQLRRVWKDKVVTERSFFVDVTTIRDHGYSLALNTYQKRGSQVPTVKLSSLLRDDKVIIGFTPPTLDDACWFGGRHTWVTIQDLGDGMYVSDSKKKISDSAIKKGKLLPAGTLLFSFKLTVGKVGIATKPLYTNEAIAGLIVEDETVKKYLYYLLPRLDYRTNRAAKGNTLHRAAVGDLDIPFEPDKIKSWVADLDAIEAARQAVVEEKRRLDREKVDYIASQILRVPSL